MKMGLPCVLSAIVIWSRHASGFVSGTEVSDSGARTFILILVLEPVLHDVYTCSKIVFSFQPTGSAVL